MTLQLQLRSQRGDFSIDVELETTGVTAVVGPNGSGKTTCLRAIAGLTERDQAQVILDGEDISGWAADERRVGFVFADRRLFPHLTVLDNVAFGARQRGSRRTQARKQAQVWLERLELAALAALRPSALSSGQEQKVALARALAARPRALLLDEPTASLDVGVRSEIREFLRHHLADIEVPVLLVTHDPVEALLLADRLCVLEAGRITQIGTPVEVASRPKTEFAARLGGLNLYSGVVSQPGRLALDQGGEMSIPESHQVGARLHATLRPSSISLALGQPQGSARNKWPGVVESVEPLGDSVRLQVSGKPGAFVDLTPAALAELSLAPGRDVWLSAKATDLETYPADQRG